MKKVLCLVIVVVLVAAMFVACTSNETPAESSSASESSATPSETPSESSPEPSAEASPDPSSEIEAEESLDASGATGGAATEPAEIVNATKDYNLVGLWWSRGFEFMVALDRGCKDEVEKLGASIEILDGNSDSALQVSQIEDNISKGVDGIILAPNNTEDLVVGVKKANDAGVPVVTVDALVNQETVQVESSVSFDNYKAAQMLGQAVIDMFPDGGTVLENTGDLTFGHAQRRSQGFHDALDATGKFEIIQKDAKWTAENAQAATVDNLNANPDIVAIYCGNEVMLGGVVAGLKQVNMLKTVGEEGHIALFAVDGSPEGLRMVRNGEADGLAEQNAFNMGQYAADSMIAHLEGAEVAPEILIQPVYIDASNVDDPSLWGNVWEAGDYKDA